MISRIVVVGVTVLTMARVPSAIAQCTGDCSGDGEVTVNEIVLGVNIALGNATADQCASFDTNGDGQVSINEVIGAVSSALSGCPVTAATPTPTGTPIPVVTPTPTEAIVPPGISTRMLGIWSGRALNESTGVNKPAQIKIDVAGGKVVVTDLGGNVFASGSTLTATVTTPTVIAVARTVGSYPGGYAEALQLALAPNGQLAGTYGTTSLTLPPKLIGIGLVLDKES